MIVPMKKVFVVALDKDIDSVLEALCGAGTVHVEHHKKPVGTKVDDLKEKVNRMAKVVEVLSAQDDHYKPVHLDNCQKECDEIWEWIYQVDELEEDVAQRQYLIHKWEPWGNFKLSDIENFKENGIFIRLVEVPVAELKNEHKNVILEPIFTQDKIARCLAISREEEELAFKILSFPKQSLDELKSLQQDDQERIQALKNNIKDAAKYLTSLKDGLLNAHEELAFQEVYAGRREQENLTLVKGFCPDDRCDSLEKFAQKEKWGLLIEEPSKDDQIPTLLRNPKWVNIIKPLFNIINVLPGYSEVDVSAIFLLFFSVFFGILIGDAGYGLIIAVATGAAHIKLRKKVRNKAPFILMYILSGCTILWGVLTGTFFGQQWIEGIVQPLVPWLNDIKNIQVLCFFIGAFHLSLAHVWRGIMKFPAPTFLSEIGWIVILWGIFFAARLLVLGEELAHLTTVFVASGSILVVLFACPGKNILKIIGGGFLELVGNIVNSFTDVVSYIRLFAVGLATVAVADAFNTMAIGIGFDTVATGLMAALIIVVGHLFNIVLGAMSILVHGLRLNVLEFSNHMNLEWAGFKYDPFRKIEKGSI